MKSYYSFLIAVFVCTITNAQNISDVLRYGNQNTQGTARYQALSGAFGALGGDLSAIGVNPAGSAVFNYSQFTVSGTNYNRNNDATYTNRTLNTELNSVNINQVGGVLVLKSPNNNSWKKIALAFNYEVAENFDNEFSLSGSTNDGLGNYFENIANGVPFGSLLLLDGEFLEDAYEDIGTSLGFIEQQAFLGFQSGIIDPQDDTNDDNTIYNKNTIGNNINQTFIQTTRGYNSKVTLNASGEYEDNLYLGAALNFHIVDFEKITQLRERGYDATSPIKFSAFDNLLQTNGGGVSFSLGAITKLNDNIRVGGSYQSPTWYFLQDETSQRIDSDSPVKNEDLRFINFDNVVNLFEHYTIKIPSKLTGSIAIVFGKDGLLSFDYGYQDMSKAELKPTNTPAFQTENEFISNELAPVSSFKIGGEYRIKQVSLRGGYRFEQSPYENAITIGDLEGYSAGIGYNFGASKLDLTVNRTEQDINEQLFDTGINSPALVNNINTNVTLSYTMNF